MYFIDDIRTFKPECPQEENDRRLMLEAACSLPEGILTRAHELYHMTASSMIVNEARTHVLMAYHNIYDSWAWTGGHADGESDLMKVATREAREETGIRTLTPLSTAPVSLEILHVQPHIKRGRYVSSHLHMNLTYAFIGDDTEEISVKPDENARVGWLPIDSLDDAVREKDMLPYYKKILSRMLQFQSFTRSISLK